MTVDRRASPRQALGRDVLICSDGGKAIGACHLCDVSSSGARLAITPRVLAKLPEEFILVLAKQAKVHRSCRIVWRGQEEIGVRFINSTSVRRRSAGAANSAASPARSPATAG
ncbi:MAG: PilZ domain-containing protein [Hyphomicrobiales bacterium]|nr:PilZ domain-containing protein [Hyphomicrobiales bacterium]MBV8823836.1 PilZ domain-containing protein [Hyphomicrobiales bacterium]MBV9430001.1 PilZ domain-containing protein [Bradyrhizobiaceae bacterium]